MNERNMNVIREEAREIPIAFECDVCIVGGSCTGVFAAINAARLGAKVAIVERNGFFGGAATAQFINGWHQIHNETLTQQIVAGRTVEVVERLKKRNAVVFREQDPKLKRLGWCTVSTEVLKIELDEMVLETGVQPFLHASFSSPIMSDGKVVAVAIEDKSGRRAIKASYFIDATGDADLIYRMGLPTHKNDMLQNTTMLSNIRGLDEIKKKHPGFDLNKVVFDPQYRQALKPARFWQKPEVGSRDDWQVAGTAVNYIDCSDADQLTKAEMEGRRQVRAICDILLENFIEDDLQPLVMIAPELGVRESRQARCLHTLTGTEVLSGKRFPDAIANGSVCVDIHRSDKPVVWKRYLDGTEENILHTGERVWSRWRDETSENPTFYQIPYSSLVPKGATNVLVAGRAIDVDRDAFAAMRVIVLCNQIGEAAGTAAYLALDGNISVAEVDTSKLREVMQKQGSIII